MLRRCQFISLGSANNHDPATVRLDSRDEFQLRCFDSFCHDLKKPTGLGTGALSARWGMLHWCKAILNKCIIQVFCKKKIGHRVNDDLFLSCDSNVRRGRQPVVVQYHQLVLVSGNHRRPG